MRYAYDLRGNLVSSKLAMGQETRYTYDTQNRKTAEVDANGYTATWRYDYFGQLQARSDIGGARYELRSRGSCDQEGQVSHFPF